MDNKKLGILIIVLAISLLVLGTFFRFKLVESYNSNMMMDSDSTSCSVSDEESCPHQKVNQLLLPTIIGIVIIVLVIVVGVYFVFVESDQKAIKQNQEKLTKTIEETKKQEDENERFELIMSALDEDEKKIIKAVKDQDGITQATLRIRTGISKSKLSILLSRLEKKDLIKKVLKGKTNQVFLKRQI